MWSLVLLVYSEMYVWSVVLLCYSYGYVWSVVLLCYSDGYAWVWSCYVTAKLMCGVWYYISPKVMCGVWHCYVTAKGMRGCGVAMLQQIWSVLSLCCSWGFVWSVVLQLKVCVECSIIFHPRLCVERGIAMLQRSVCAGCGIVMSLHDMFSFSVHALWCMFSFLSLSSHIDV